MEEQLSWLFLRFIDFAFQDSGVSDYLSLKRGGKYINEPHNGKTQRKMEESRIEMHGNTVYCVHSAF